MLIAKVDKIIELRKAHGLNQKRLSEKAGLPVNAVFRIETGAYTRTQDLRAKVNQYGKQHCTGKNLRPHPGRNLQAGIADQQAGRRCGAGAAGRERQRADRAHAEHLYFGKVMAGRKPKHVTNKDIRYTTTFNRLAGPFWLERLMAAEKDRIIEDERRNILGGP